MSNEKCIDKKKKNILIRINDILSEVQIKLSVVFLFIFITLVVFEIGSRYLFRRSMIWAPEIATLSLAWSVFLASAVCFRSDSHLMINILNLEKYPRLESVHRVLVCLINFVFLFALVRYGLRTLPLGATRGSPILGIPVYTGWVSLVIMGITGVSYMVESLFFPGRVDEKYHAPSGL